MSEQGRMPVGEWIEIQDYMTGFDCWVQVKVKYIGDSISVCIDEDNKEIAIRPPVNWRYHVDKEQQKRDEILESWRRLSLDNAHDSESSTAHIGSFINMLIDNGYVEVEK